MKMRFVDVGPEKTTDHEHGHEGLTEYTGSVLHCVWFKWNSWKYRECLFVLSGIREVHISLTEIVNPPPLTTIWHGVFIIILDTFKDAKMTVAT